MEVPSLMARMSESTRTISFFLFLIDIHIHIRVCVYPISAPQERHWKVQKK